MNFTEMFSLQSWLGRYQEIFRRFPLTVIMTVVAMCLILFLIEVEESSTYTTLIKITFTAILGIFLFTAFRLLGDKNPLCLFAVVALVGYYFLLPDGFSQMAASRHFFLSLALFMMILWAPFWKENPSNEHYWSYNQQVIFAFGTSIVFTLIVYAGLSGALFSIDHLFGLDIDNKRHPQLFFLVIGLFGVNYFLSQIPDKATEIGLHTYSKVENILTRYILTPLSIGYFLILYIYSAKILITQSWPKGILAWIIIAFSVVAMITYLFYTPLWKEKNRRYKRFLPLILLLQTLMLAVAIGMRIEAYGWTESRYMVAILGLWLFGVSLYFLLFKDAKIKWIFISLSLIIMISQLGPYSAYHVGERSQQARLQKLLESKQKFSEETPITVRYEISDKIRYLFSHHGLKSLESVLPTIVKEYKSQKNDPYKEDFTRYATKKLGFTYVSKWEMLAAKRGEKVFRSLYRTSRRPLYIKGYDWIGQVGYARRDKLIMYPPMTGDMNNPPFSLILTPQMLRIKEGNQTISTVDLVPFLKKIREDKSLFLHTPEYAYEDERLKLAHQDQNCSIMIYLNELNLEANDTIETMFAEVLYKNLQK